MLGRKSRLRSQVSTPVQDYFGLIGLANNCCATSIVDQTLVCGGRYGSGVYAVAMRDMVKRDRNHVSIIMWSFCNVRCRSPSNHPSVLHFEFSARGLCPTQELECAQYDSDYSGEAFRAAAKGVDSTRPVAANGAMSQIPFAQLDIWGGSHWSNSSFAKAHQQNATKPEVLSECCSCTSQRTDRDMDATCIGNQNSPGTIPTVMGSLGGMCPHRATIRPYRYNELVAFFNKQLLLKNLAGRGFYGVQCGR